MPDIALSVLRSSGRDWHVGIVNKLNQAVEVPLAEAITAVRVRLECGLLTEAYLYQRAHWSRVKSEEARRRGNKIRKQDVDDLEEPRNWSLELEALVGEICWFSIRSNLLKEMTDLPWLSDEEKVVKKYLLDQAVQDPSSSAGNFLVVFYVQVCRQITTELSLVNDTEAGLPALWTALVRRWVRFQCSSAFYGMTGFVELFLDQAETCVESQLYELNCSQRCRYVEAYLVHKRLCDLEQQYMGSCRKEEKRIRCQTACAHRTRITVSFVLGPVHC